MNAVPRHRASWRIKACRRMANLITLTVLPRLGALNGCAAPLALPPGAGVTTGGQEDIASARQSILNGKIPDAASITPEGFLSEHGIPLTSPPGDGLLYTEAAVAWSRPFDAFSPLVTVRIGLGSSADPSTYERPPLNLCLLIDRSKSMEDPIDERSGTTKLEAVRVAVDRILGNLDSRDRVSIVLFNASARVLLEDVPGDDVATIKNALSTIETAGDTDLAAGLRSGFSALDRHDAEGKANRLMVFTDAELRTRQERRVQAFLGVMQEYAARNFGTTLFGVGSAFGYEVAYDISQVRGGNYYFLDAYDRIVDIFDNEFRFLVAPIAYDVAVGLSVPYSFDVTGIYGFPFTEPLANQLTLRIPSLFLSSREGGGAMLVRVRPGALVDFGQQTTVATISMSYETSLGATETAPTVRTVLPAGLDSTAETEFYEDDAIKRATLLLDTALVLHNACEDAQPSCPYSYCYDYYYGSGVDAAQRATSRLTEFLPYFDRLAADLENQVSPSSRSLSQERALVQQLLTNIEDLLRLSGVTG